MNTNDSNRRDVLDDVIELGVASVETKGTDLGFEPVGQIPMPGMSEE